jgi:hypothetical protein
MGAKSVRYHQGASADVKSAVAWYRKGSPKAASDFVAELDRAVATIREGPERRSEKMGRWEKTRLDGSFCGDFLFPLFTLSRKARSSCGPSRMAADGLSIGLVGLNELKLQMNYVTCA